MVDKKYYEKLGGFSYVLDNLRKNIDFIEKIIITKLGRIIFNPKRYKKEIQVYGHGRISS